LPAGLNNDPTIGIVAGGSDSFAGAAGRSPTALSDLVVTDGPRAVAVSSGSDSMVSPVVSPNADLTASFRSHENYLCAFGSLAGFPFMPGKGHQILENIANDVMAVFPQTNRPRQLDTDELSGCLNRAWGTELLLAMSMRFVGEDEMMRISNSWGCVQLYYVGYSSVQALVVASGQSRPASHPKTQDQAITFWANRQSGAAPFSFAAKPGSVSNRDPKAYAHGPGRDIDVNVHSWTACDSTNCWDIAGLALRTTRQDAVEKQLAEARQKKIRQKRKDWQTAETARLAKGKPPRTAPVYKTAQLSDAEKDACEQNVRAYGWLDYLYRLRIKANYEEARMFTEGPDDEHTSALVARNMIRLATAVMIAHEVRIAQIVGKKTLLDMANTWVAANSPPPSMGIGLRLPILDKVL
jgi:hypothetical protein